MVNVMDRQLVTILASKIDARLRCLKNGNEWADKHEDMIVALVREHMPSGSGFDSGTTMDLDVSTGEKLVFLTSFHHMNDVGMYDGWTEHAVTVRPSLVHGFLLTISGRDRRGIKDYMHEIFHVALSDVISREHELAMLERLAS